MDFESENEDVEDAECSCYLPSAAQFHAQPRRTTPLLTEHIPVSQPNSMMSTKECESQDKLPESEYREVQDNGTVIRNSVIHSISTIGPETLSSRYLVHHTHRET